VSLIPFTCCHRLRPSHHKPGAVRCAIVRYRLSTWKPAALKSCRRPLPLRKRRWGRGVFAPSPGTARPPPPPSREGETERGKRLTARPASTSQRITTKDVSLAGYQNADFVPLDDSWSRRRIHQRLSPHSSSRLSCLRPLGQGQQAISPHQCTRPRADRRQAVPPMHGARHLLSHASQGVGDGPIALRQGVVFSRQLPVESHRTVGSALEEGGGLYILLSNIG
jgi:hypothetical protein